MEIFNQVCLQSLTGRINFLCLGAKTPSIKEQLLKKKLTLISLPLEQSREACPLATAMLNAQVHADANLNASYDVKLQEFFPPWDLSLVCEDILSKQPDLVGFSVYVWNHVFVASLARELKRRKSNLILFAGGAEATAAPGVLLAQAGLDFVVAGEGEEILCRVLKHILEQKSLDGLPGVYLPAYDSLETLLPVPVMELDKLSSPFLSGVWLPEKSGGVLWELSRGCSFQCDFCFESKGARGVRRYGLKRLEAELRLFEKRKVSQIFVLDPTFNQDAERAREILRLMQKIAPDIHYTFEVRTEFLDQEMADLFAALRCTLQIGLQSARREVLQKVSRDFNPKKYALKIGLLNEAGVTFGLDLIYGLPGDTLAGFRESLDYALALQPNHLDIFPLSVLPGTQLFERAGELGLDFLSEPPYTLLSSGSFSQKDMEAAHKLKEACELFYNRGGAVGWLFMALETLGMKASDFLERFSEWYKAEKLKRVPDRLEISALQVDFCRKLMEEARLISLFPVLRDVILYQGALNHSLWAGPMAASAPDTRLNLDKQLQICPGSVFLELSFDPDSLMELGELNFEEFLATYSSSQVFVLVYNHQGTVKTVLFSDAWLGKLMRARSAVTLEQVLKGFSAKERKKALELVEFGLGEGIFYFG